MATGTFGLDIGNNNSAEGGDVILAARFQNTVATGNITQLEFEANDGAPGGNAIMGIYADGGAGAIGALLLETVGQAVVDDWNVFVGLNQAAILNTWYVLCLMMSAGNTLRYQNAMGADSGCYDDTEVYHALPANWTSANYGTNNFVMRATVTYGGAAVPFNIGAVASMMRHKLSLPRQLVLPPFGVRSWAIRGG